MLRNHLDSSLAMKTMKSNMPVEGMDSCMVQLKKFVMQCNHVSVRRAAYLMYKRAPSASWKVFLSDVLMLADECDYSKCCKDAHIVEKIIMCVNDDKLVERLLRKGTMPTVKECKLEALRVASLRAAKRSNESEQVRRTWWGKSQGLRGNLRAKKPICPATTVGSLGILRKIATVCRSSRGARVRAQGQGTKRVSNAENKATLQRIVLLSRKQG